MAEVPPLLAQPLTDRAQLDFQRDKLVEATKECVGILANALDPAMGHYALFEDDAARTDQSERLRKDLWVFREMCRYTASSLEKPDATPEAAEPLRRYATEFRDVGYQLLRHSDRELFDRFLDLLEGWSGRRGESTQIRIARLRDDCHRFADILERALDLVSRRTEAAKDTDRRGNVPGSACQSGKGTVREALAYPALRHGCRSVAGAEPPPAPAGHVTERAILAESLHFAAAGPPRHGCC